jgi:hypothetical protein
MTANGLLNVTIDEEDVEYDMHGGVKHKEKRTGYVPLDQLKQSLSSPPAGASTTARRGGSAAGTAAAVANGRDASSSRTEGATAKGSCCGHA